MDGEVRETQLFNLAENPNEFLKDDLAETPALAEKLAEMEALLLSEMRRLDDPYRLWNQPDDGLEPVKQAPKKPRKPKAKKGAKK